MQYGGNPAGVNRKEKLLNVRNPDHRVNPQKATILVISIPDNSHAEYMR
jgi:hypothetical protein